jgi:hypothetical protein
MTAAILSGVLMLAPPLSNAAGASQLPDKTFTSKEARETRGLDCHRTSRGVT